MKSLTVQIKSSSVSCWGTSVREDFVTFLECDRGITGRALADKTLTFLSSHGLDPSNLWGQAYDGAGNMSGSSNGTAALISNDYPLALYLYCASHSLNLAVVKSLDETSVQNMIGVMNSFNLFLCSSQEAEETWRGHRPNTGRISCQKAQRSVPHSVGRENWCFGSIQKATFILSFLFWDHLCWRIELLDPRFTHRCQHTSPSHQHNWLPEWTRHHQLQLELFDGSYKKPPIRSQGYCWSCVRDWQPHICFSRSMRQCRQVS